jgi:hypothetical protein
LEATDRSALHCKARADWRKDSRYSCSVTFWQDTAEGDLLFACDGYSIGLFQVVQLFSLASIEDCVNLGLRA